MCEERTFLAMAKTDAQIEELRELIDKSSAIVAVTGAGISFSTGGLSFGDTGRGDFNRMMAIGSEDVLRNDPALYYDALDEFFLHAMFSGGPTLAHRALAKIEQRGKMKGIITTNIDCLHTMAGSRNVAEIQGSLQVNRCCDCGKHYDDYEIWHRGKVPVCSCGGKIWAFPFYSHIGLKDDEVEKARSWISTSDLILVIGANGAYAGAYWSDRAYRATVVQINPGRTYFDGSAKLNIRLGADEVFSRLDL